MGGGGDDLAHAGGLLQSDPRYRPFLQEDFNAANFASRALAETHTSAQAQVETLQAGIAALDVQLRAEVLHRQDELIGQTARLGEVETALARTSISVRSLQSVAARVRAEVAAPHAEISARTVQLRNLQGTMDLLRHVIHRLRLVQKLRAQVAGAEAAAAAGHAATLDLAKAARLLADIAAVDAEADLAGIEAVEADAEFVASAGAQLRAQTEAALRAGLASLSQADVGSALQVLYNLGELAPSVEAWVDASAAAVERGLAAALDARKLTAAAASGGGGGGGGARGLLAPGPGSAVSGSKVGDAAWARLGEALEGLSRGALEAWHLQRVLLKKRDPLTHALFIDAVAPGDEDELPLDRFWRRVLEGARSCFASAYGTARGGFVRDALLAGYPRLAGMLEGAAAGLLRDSAARDVDPAISPEQAAALAAAASGFGEGYLAAAMARMGDAIAGAFPGTGRPPPGAADLQRCVARLHEEIKAAAGSPGVAAAAAAAVGQAVSLLAERAAYMAAPPGPELRSMSGACTSTQARNIGLANGMQEVHRSLAGLLPRMPPRAVDALRGPLEGLQGAAMEVVAPMFRAAVETGEEALLRMHAREGGLPGAGGPSASGGADSAGGGVTETSPYMRDLVRHLAHVRVELLSKFSPAPSAAVPSLARALVERMAARLLVFAVRHAALVRPLPHAARLALAKDLAELEAAAAQSLGVAGAGAGAGPARMLRAFRRLLFTDTAALAAEAAGGRGRGGAAAGPPLLRDLPRTVVLHHLYSRAPPSLESPHVRAGLTPAQYSLWMDEHSGEEALRFVRTALEACAGRARGEGGAGDFVLVELMLHLSAPP